MSISNRSGGSGFMRATGLLALTGALVITVPVEAQTRAQTAGHRGSSLHVQRGQPAVTTPATQRGAAVAPAPISIRSGVRSTFPEPIRPGQRRLHLPRTELPPREVVETPPFVIIPGVRERRRQEVFIVHQPYLPHYYHDQQYVQPHMPPSQLVPPAAVGEAPEPEPLTGRELGDAYLHWDEPDRAITVYQEHLLEEPDDAEAIRMLGLALIDAGRLQEGIATVALAYDKSPELAQRPLPEDVFGLTRDLRRNLNRVSLHANRVDTASAWLALAVLMQAEGRTRPASNMVDRAERAGLSEDVLETMRAAVGTRS